MFDTFQGKAWVFGDNINSESILNSGLEYELDEAKKHILEVYDPDFPQQVKQGDIVVAGKNFGTSSSRPSGMLLRMAGVAAVVCESSSIIFYRNTWSRGLPVLECPGVTKIVNKGDLIEINIKEKYVKNMNTGQTAEIMPVPEKLLDVCQRGGLLEWIMDRKHLYDTIES